MRKDLSEQAPVLSFFSRPIPNSHQVIDTVNCLKSTIDVYNAYNNEKTRLNFGIFYTIIRNRWSNISSKWNSDKLFNIVSHYAAAKQGFIIVNATEIDYEDIRKSSDTASDLSNSTSDSQYNIINKFYNSLNLDQTSTTSINHNIAIKENKSSVSNMNKIQTSELLLNNTLLTESETSEQQTTSNSITFNISSTSLTILTS